MCYARRQRSSWARIKLSKNLYHISASLSYNLSSYFILASFTLLSIYNSFDEICTCFFALYLSLVVQFSMTVCRLLRDDFVIISQPFLIVNTFFESFLSFFNFFLFDFRALHASAWLFYHFSAILSSTFFNFFYFFISLHTLTDFEYIYSTFIV